MNPSTRDELFIIVDGIPHKGWQQAQITRSIEAGPHQFSLTLSDRWVTGKNTQENEQLRTIQVGMPVEVLINDELIVSGYVDELAPSYDETSHSIRLTGSSKLSDLVACSSAGKQFKGQSLLSICKTLCKPFAITVQATDNAAIEANKVFTGRTHTLDLGQTLWDFLEELARIRGVLLTSDADGNLVILKAGTDSADIALELGKNIQRANGSFSAENLFSEYHVSGQQPSTPKDKGYIGAKVSQPKAQAKAVVKSKGINRYRPFYISSDNPLSAAQCQARADWQKNVHEGRAERVTYTLSGWRQTIDGRLWTPNELVAVVDPWVGLDKERLIVETVFTLGEDGSHTELTVLPKSAFAKEPELPTVTKKAQSKRKGYLSPTGEML